MNGLKLGLCALHFQMMLVSYEPIGGSKWVIQFRHSFEVESLSQGVLKLLIQILFFQKCSHSHVPSHHIVLLSSSAQIRFTSQLIDEV